MCNLPKHLFSSALVNTQSYSDYLQWVLLLILVFLAQSISAVPSSVKKDTISPLLGSIFLYVSAALHGQKSREFAVRVPCNSVSKQG